MATVCSSDAVFNMPDMLPELLELIASKCTPKTKLQLFRASHACRKLVLTTSKVVKLKRAPRARVLLLPSLLDLPAASDGTSISKLIVDMR
jgi:hypothetical protein